MNRWLARFGFSFIILAAVLAWEGYRASGASAGTLRIAMFLVGAAILFVLGLIGVRARHREK